VIFDSAWVAMAFGPHVLSGEKVPSHTMKEPCDRLSQMTEIWLLNLTFSNPLPKCVIRWNYAKRSQNALFDGTMPNAAKMRYSMELSVWQRFVFLTFF